MLPRSVLSSAIVLGVVVLASSAFAQRQPPPGSTTQSTPEVLPAQGTGGDGPATETPEKKPASSGSTAGYAYSDKPTASSRSTHTRYRKQGPVVNLPGFEQTADGGSRLFVQLSQTVPVEERKAPGSITYVLKGASPRVWNNTNALVTVHFNTPVSRARLVPQGKDLLFVIDLRAAATPTWKISESADKGATLTIDFPKGEYLQGGAEPAPAAQPEAAAAAPKATRGRRGARKGGAAPAPAPAKPTPAPPADGPKP